MKTDVPQKKLSYSQRRSNLLKIRKKLKKPTELDKGTRFSILEDYLSGLIVIDLAEKYYVHPDTMETWIQTFYNKFVNTRETNSLIQSQAYSDRNGGWEVAPKFKNPDKVNEEFVALLSDEDSLVPSEAEMAYANLYAHTGDNRQAILASGLDAGLRAKRTEDKHLMIKLRGVYIRNKPQVANAISKIRDRIIEDLTVDKSLIQNELLQQIKQLKEEVADKPTQRGNLIKCIEMLGKSIPGTFQDRLEIHKVDKQTSLSTLVEQLQAAELQEIESGKEMPQIPQVIDGEFEEL